MMWELAAGEGTHLVVIDVDYAFREHDGGEPDAHALLGPGDWRQRLADAGVDPSGWTAFEAFALNWPGWGVVDVWWFEDEVFATFEEVCAAAGFEVGESAGDFEYPARRLPGR